MTFLFGQLFRADQRRPINPSLLTKNSANMLADHFMLIVTKSIPMIAVLSPLFADEEENARTLF